MFGVYIILWLSLSPFYGGLPAFAFLFPRPLVAIVAASGAFALFLAAALATAGALMTSSGLRQQEEHTCKCHLFVAERKHKR